MKKNLFILLLIIICIKSNAQFTLDLKRSNSSGENEIMLREITSDNGIPKAVFLVNGKERQECNPDQLKKMKFEIRNLKDFWQNQAVFGGVYESLLSYGTQYDLRKELENDALGYLKELGQNKLFFNDSYLENYLYSIVYKIYPGSINDGRPGILNVKIMVDNNPNSFIFPNGTMVITTGLLSTINSEEELIAVMAHEISHFVLDHSIFNINKTIQRQKNAEFWAAFATGLAAAADIYTSSKNEYYVPGRLTYNIAILSNQIASSFSQRLGLKYSREQEYAADQCGVQLIKFLKIDSTALSSALSKIGVYCIKTGNFIAISGEGTHPSIQNRIRTMGKPNQFNSPSYDKMISFVISNNAIIEFNESHFNICNILIDRNIKAGVPCEDDLVLKAMTNLCLYDNIEKNNENLELIKRAKNLNVLPSINIFKQEALILIRLKKFSEALVSLQTYEDKLSEESIKIDKIRNESLWTSTMQYIDNEVNWTKKMKDKVKSM
jgi:Zn-dependent protease with chaperone function